MSWLLVYVYQFERTCKGCIQRGSCLIPGYMPNFDLSVEESENLPYYYYKYEDWYGNGTDIPKNISNYSLDMGEISREE